MKATGVISWGWPFVMSSGQLIYLSLEFYGVVQGEDIDMPFSLLCYPFLSILVLSYQLINMLISLQY